MKPVADALRTVAELLDLAASTDDVVVHRRAVDRITAGLSRTSRRIPDGLRGASVPIEQLLDRFDVFGVPARPRVLRPDSVHLARTLRSLDDGGLEAVVFELGVVEAAALARSLDRAAAADVVRALAAVRDRLDAAAPLAPNLEGDGLRASMQRYAALAPRGFMGGVLARALGRSLAGRLVAEGEPDVVAVLRRRLPCVDELATTVEEVWFSVASRVVRNIVPMGR